MDWYVIYTKPSQEQRALENLQRQGYECYLPMRTVEKIRRGIITTVDEPLFPRYLFVSQTATDHEIKSWASIRSTKGVIHLITFGNEPAKMDDQFVQQLKLMGHRGKQKLFINGEKLQIMEGPFKGLEAIYQMDNGESRVMVLIDFLGKQTTLITSPKNLQKQQ